MKDEDTNISTEQVQKLTPSLTIMTLAGKNFKMREMAIGRLEKFLEKLNECFKKIQDALKMDEETFQENYKKEHKLTEKQWEALEKKPTYLGTLEISAFLTRYSEIAFGLLSEIFNFIFSYKNGNEYEAVTAEWIGENLTVREMGLIVDAVTEQNNIKGAIPFLKSFARREYEKVLMS